EISDLRPRRLSVRQKRRRGLIELIVAKSKVEIEIRLEPDPFPISIFQGLLQYPRAKSTRLNSSRPSNHLSSNSSKTPACLSQSRSLTPLVCGVINKFGTFQSGLSAGNGSNLPTSIAAPPS